MANIIIAGKRYENISKITFNTPTGGKATFVLYDGTIDNTPAVFDRVFANNTPAQISAVSEEIASNGYTSTQVAEIYGWNLGDLIPITLTSGENIEMRIIGINHDNLSDGSGKAGLTLEMVNCLTTKYPMNTESTNAGGYPASIMKTETLPTIKSLLPQEWQDVIKLVNKKSANGGDTNYSEIVTTSEDLFLLARVEMTGTSDYAQDSLDEGTQYEYWMGKTTNADRIKKYDSDGDGELDTATIYFNRSCALEATTFASYWSSGTMGTYTASISQGVSFAFCI